MGSIPFGLVLTRFAGKGDIRKIGSGNIGATNVLRGGGKGLAAATLLLDGAKGAAAVLPALQFGPDMAVIAGTAVLLGHMFPIWMRFRGGKGVSTFAGVILAFDWPAGLMAVGVWVLVAAVFRLSSLAALVAAPAICLYAYFKLPPQLFELFTFITVLVYIRHHSNIRNLLTGKEDRFDRKLDV